MHLSGLFDHPPSAGLCALLQCAIRLLQLADDARNVEHLAVHGVNTFLGFAWDCHLA